MGSDGSPPAREAVWAPRRSRNRRGEGHVPCCQFLEFGQLKGTDQPGDDGSSRAKIATLPTPHRLGRHTHASGYLRTVHAFLKPSPPEQLRW